MYHASLVSLKSDGSSDSQELHTQPGSKEQSPQTDPGINNQMKNKQYETNHLTGINGTPVKENNLYNNNFANHNKCSTDQPSKPGKESSNNYLNGHAPIQNKRSLDDNLTGSFSTSFAVNKTYDAYRWKNGGKSYENVLAEKKQFSPILSPGNKI